jgi:hypothetical protein
MNVWDALVLTVAVTLAADRPDSAVYSVRSQPPAFSHHCQHDGVLSQVFLIGRCLRNGKIILNAAKTTNLMCKVRGCTSFPVVVTTHRSRLCWEAAIERPICERERDAKVWF